MSSHHTFPSEPNCVRVNVRSDVQIAEGAVTEVRLSRLLRDVKTAEDQVASGLRSEQARVEARLRAMLGR